MNWVERMKITQEEFRSMIKKNDAGLLEHLILNSSTDEVIESYHREEAMEIVLTINGIEVDIMPFLKLLEDQYDRQTALSAKKLYTERADKILAPFHEAANIFIQLYDHMEGEVKEAVSKATDVSWLFDEDPEEVD